MSLFSREKNRSRAAGLVRDMLAIVAPGQKLGRQIETLQRDHLPTFGFWRLYDLRRGAARRVDEPELARLEKAHLACRLARAAHLRAELAALEADMHRLTAGTE